MTTVAMIFGMMPLALAIGEGAEQRAPMARAVIGGLITSTLLTLFVVPVVYTLLDDLGSWVSARLTSAQRHDARWRPCRHRDPDPRRRRLTARLARHSRRRTRAESA